jgi:hypothetical protein
MHRDAAHAQFGGEGLDFDTTAGVEPGDGEGERVER